MNDYLNPKKYIGLMNIHGFKKKKPVKIDEYFLQGGKCNKYFSSQIISY